MIWYGSKILIIDVLAASTIAFVAVPNGYLVTIIGYLAFLFGGPIVHWKQNQRPRVLASFAMRILGPIVFGYLGGQALCSYFGGCSGDWFGITLIIYRVAGAAVGAFVAGVVDIVWARHPPMVD